MTSITISIPAYNEAQNIGVLIEDVILEIRDIHEFAFQILVIDDGSYDDTPKILSSLSKKYPIIKIHTHKKNMGFGQTIKEVFQMPKSDWVLFISGDNQFPASNIPILIEYIQEFDFILGYRAVRIDNYLRRFISYFYNKVISVIVKREIKDTSSIALVKFDLLQSLSLNSKSGFIHAEILLKSLKKGCKFIEVPILHNERSYGEASGGKLKTILFTIFELFKYSIGRL